MRSSAYPAYRDSGLEWLEEVPEHWEAKRLKYVASINDEALSESTPPDFELSYVDISSVGASAGIVAIEEMVFEDAPSRARRVVRDGDTIVSTVRTYLRAIAPIRAPRNHLIVSTGFAVVRPRNVDPSFLSYALRETRFVESIVARSAGVSYPAVNASDVATIPVPVPPFVEQRAIAAFLDRQTAKLDSLIEKKRALIELMKEKRSALISRIVTRGLPQAAARAAGLDPHPRLKPSGVEWLGDVPEQWGASPLKHVTGFVNGEAFKPDEWSDEGVPIIRIENLNGGPDFNCYEGPVDRRYHVAKGELLFGWSGNRGTSFGPFIWWREGLHYLNQHIFKLVGFECDKAWLYWCLKAVTRAVEDEAHGIIGMVHITRGKLGAIKVPTLPWPEQRAIADYLDRETAKLDQMAGKVEEAIARLQEYRAALITAAVTGKIDVRGEVPKLVTDSSCSTMGTRV